jgi:hypothetical protein
MTLAREVVRKFDSALTTSIAAHREVLLAIDQKIRQASLESMLSEQFALSASVHWEVFLSDLLLAYVSEDPSTFLGGLERRIDQSIREKFGKAVRRSVEIRMPKTLRVAQTAAWVDPKDFNVTFASAEILTRRANDLISGQYAKRFSLDVDDIAFVDFVVALRNFLAHRSNAARSTLKTVVRGLSGPNAALAGSVHSIGTYLKNRAGTGDSRAILMASRMKAIATKLA